jgi:hypothetical protein
MRRVLALAATTALVLAGGCGGKSYEVRLGKTLDAMKYRKKLDELTNPAPTKGKLEQHLIFVRPPKGLSTEPAKSFLLTELEPGKFDVTDSFLEKDKQNFHILARVKLPKGPANKKGAQPEPEKAVRGDFVSDVLGVLSAVYNVELDPSKAKEETKQPTNNRFKHLTFEAAGKDVQVYFYGSKTGPYEVALIFEYPKSEQNALVRKIDYTLGSFAVGERARRAFTGGVVEEEGAEGAATTAPGAF